MWGAAVSVLRCSPANFASGIFRKSLSIFAWLRKSLKPKTPVGAAEREGALWPDNIAEQRNIQAVAATRVRRNTRASSSQSGEWRDAQNFLTYTITSEKNGEQRKT